MGENMQNLFDETSGRWIKILKWMTIVLFYLLILAGFIVGIVQAADYGDFAQFLLLFFSGTVLAFAQLLLYPQCKEGYGYDAYRVRRRIAVAGHCRTGGAAVLHDQGAGIHLCRQG